MDSNAFGKLVRYYRKQRRWTQGELAERWGFTREYVSQIERGKRKLDKQEQVSRLADILNIPEERLEAVGKGVPRRFDATKPLEGGDLLLQQMSDRLSVTSLGKERAMKRLQREIVGTLERMKGI
ncbi:hypothetical protein KSF_068410 [Reticulibacter mediterranei]|uniref:HTH cro/C1-type domain-containing protein n=1 Tax=Reticulibacter mediterranei TaxID=2778369 RepID=A0A8J3IQK5_9CHLR|nr:helix-turn-helix transcriptional regulator [Reticulibacter mediterranei]GHO96793.1 hypothetical protein KSF_068410 [Reticulibacter mediterranei]